MSSKVKKTLKRQVVKRLGMVKMRRMGRRRVLRVVRREIRKAAITQLKEVGYKSACQGACGRRMKEISVKIRADRRKSEKQIIKLQKFKKKIVVGQLKQMGVVVSKKITKTYYQDKVKMLQAKFAEGLITKGQYTQYTGMLKKWTVISRRQFDVKVKRLREEIKTGTITKTDFAIKIKKLKKKVKPEVKITTE